MAAIQAHPLYFDGFYDAVDGEPLIIDADEAYVEGWLAAYECKAILQGTDPRAVRREWTAWRGEPQ